MPLLTPDRMTRVIHGVFAVLAAFFIAMALGAIFVRDLDSLPAWLGAPIGLGGAAALFSVSYLAPRRTSNIVYDEGYRHDWLHAQAMGYWAFVFAFAIGGNLVAAEILSLRRAFLSCTMGAASVPFIWFLAHRLFDRA